MNKGGGAPARGSAVTMYCDAVGGGVAVTTRVVAPTACKLRVGAASGEVASEMRLDKGLFAPDADTPIACMEDKKDARGIQPSPQYVACPSIQAFIKLCPPTLTIAK